MDVEDALELLSPAFSHPTVRKYAVSRLRQADDQVSAGLFHNIHIFSDPLTTVMKM